VQMHRLTRAVLKFIYFEYNKRHDYVNYVDYNHYTRGPRIRCVLVCSWAYDT